jgi:hypothetical protein
MKRAIDWLPKINHGDFKTLFNNFKIEGVYKGIATRKRKNRRQKQNANKKKKMLDKLNKTKAKCQWFLDREAKRRFDES